MATLKRKHTSQKEEKSSNDVQELFVDAPPDDSEEGASDSEDSEYSGLEEEADTSEDEEGSSEDAGSSNEEEEEAAEDSTDSEVDALDSDDNNDTAEELTIEEVDPDAEEFLTKYTKSKPVSTSNAAFINNQNNNKQQQQKKKKTAKKKGKQKPVEATEKPSGMPEILQKPDEYDFDSSDEEDIRNTVGNVPMEWYKEYDHIGYDLSGKKIGKPKTGDDIDEFLSKMENPDYWRTVKDKSTGQNVVLSDKDMDMVERFRRGKYVDPNIDPYAPWVDFFSHETMQHPLTAHPPQKRSFVPSRWERLRVGRMVHSIKMGWMKPYKPKRRDEDALEDPERFYELWKAEDQSEISVRYRHHIPAPKMPLPGHAESYNPPPEYLFTEEEELAWKEQDPEDRRIKIIPQKYPSLRAVPRFEKLEQERFERCLDLYLCPRQRKMRMNVNPEDLLPKLPKPKDLQPFPTTQSVVYRGHTSLIRCLSVSPGGQWMMSGADDGTVRFWEVSTGRCMRTMEVGGTVKDVAWTPNAGLCLAAAAVGENILILNPLLGDTLVIGNTDSMLAAYEGEDSKDSSVTWETCTKGEKQHNEGLRITIKHPKVVEHISWHAKGDYLSVVLAEGDTISVLIHQISKRRSQNPFKKPKGIVQKVMFHPTRPYLFVATQRYVRVYNLLKQELTKKLMTNCKWVSSMAIHPQGDNLIIGSYDCKLSWFDLDLSTKPYQTLRHHKAAIRSVCYHPRYPLFASASDDGTVIVCHGMVYNDLLQNPLIVPVKVLRGHEPTRNLGVLDCKFHPTQPWLFSSGSDNTIRLFT